MQRHRERSVLTGLLALGLAGRAAPPVSFQKQVQPILQRRCQGCHQPASRGGKLAVTSYALLKAGGTVGAGVPAGAAGQEPPRPHGQRAGAEDAEGRAAAPGGAGQPAEALGAGRRAG